jgi:carbonic anhydrase
MMIRMLFRQITRRSLTCTLGTTLLAGCAGAHVSHDQASTSNDPDHSLQLLMDGNQRFVAGRPRPRDDSRRRQQLANSQKPIAVIVSCSDSRVPPELVLDQDLGDIFVVRTAGQVVGDLELGSIEYAVEHLGTPLIVVLGHERCGAVTAAVTGGNAEGHIPAVVKAIEPAVAESKGEPGDPVDNAVRANVRDMVRKLRASDPVLSHFVHDGKLKVVGGRYDLDTGRVEILPEAEQLGAHSTREET